jgi:hypothetical protein
LRSNAGTPEAYLAELPDHRRDVVAAVRDLVNGHIDPGFDEAMEFGMIAWGVPLHRYPNTYNKRPLGYIALAAQKNYYSLYLMGAYEDSEQEAWIRQEFERAGQRCDFGKCCLRFRKLEDLPEGLVKKAAAWWTPDEVIRSYERAKGLAT